MDAIDDTERKLQEDSCSSPDRINDFEQSDPQKSFIKIDNFDNKNAIKKH